MLIDCQSEVVLAMSNRYNKGTVIVIENSRVGVGIS